MVETAAHRKRINRLKKVILGAVAMAILIPVVICVILGARVAVLSGRIESLQTQLEEERNKPQEVTGVFTTEHIEESKRETETEILSKEEEKPEEREYAKTVYLTFDDGPSSNTDEILDILKAYDVKATFFVVGKTDELSIEAYKRIVAEGHTLGMHSYSHKYEEIYESKESFIKDLSELQEYLYDLTGVWPRYYRFPGGSSNTVSKVDMQELITWLDENDIIYYDWNIASGDAVSGQLSKETIVNNCLSGLNGYSECMILMHDAADKKTTVEALPEIISGIRMRGDACFLPITDETVPVQHVTIRAEEENQ
ncbi:MAG: polysaccharide deacetylase family protein [Suilimivivens sp.]